MLVKNAGRVYAIDALINEIDALINKISLDLNSNITLD